MVWRSTKLRYKAGSTGSGQCIWEWRSLSKPVAGRQLRLPLRSTRPHYTVCCVSCIRWACRWFRSNALKSSDPFQSWQNRVIRISRRLGRSESGYLLLAHPPVIYFTDSYGNLDISHQAPYSCISIRIGTSSSSGRTAP